MTTAPDRSTELPNRHGMDVLTTEVHEVQNVTITLTLQSDRNKPAGVFTTKLERFVRELNLNHDVDKIDIEHVVTSTVRRDNSPI